MKMKLDTYMRKERNGMLEPDQREKKLAIDFYERNKEVGVSSLLNILSMNKIKKVYRVQYRSCTIFLKQEASTINIETT